MSKNKNNKKMKKDAFTILAIILSVIISIEAFISITIACMNNGCTDSNQQYIASLDLENKATTNVVVSKQNGYTTLTKPDDKPLKILQFTDIHIGNGAICQAKDKMAIDAVVKLVLNTQPDLIVLTGDSIYPVPYVGNLNNLKAMQVIGNLFESFKIPWAIVYGNHDCESFAGYEKTVLSNYLESLEYCLFEKGDSNITGEGNYIVNVNNSDGTLNTSLVMLDSNAYRTTMGTITWDYDNIHDDQVDWYVNSITNLSKGRDSVVPSLMFFHIPFNEYEDAWKLYKENSDQVKFRYGFAGEKEEMVCCPTEKGKIFDEIVKLGSTKATFCGHDHLNVWSMEYKGVILNYGMSIDYLAYFGIVEKTDQRGGTVIEIDKDSNYNISQIKLVDIA